MNRLIYNNYIFKIFYYNMNVKKYIGNFILGGLATIFVNYILENFDDGPALTAYIYVAPTIYLIIMYLTYKDRGINGYYTFLVHSFINSLFFIFSLYILILLTRYTSLECLSKLCYYQYQFL